MAQRRRRRKPPQGQRPARQAPTRPPQFPDNLARLFYWYDDYDPAQYMGVLPKMQQSPNPQHRAVAESAAALVAHMQQGRTQVEYEEPAHCRICGEPLGTQDLTNTFVAWPQGSEHYITAHGVWTPQHSWLAGVVLGRVDPRAKPPPQMTRTFRDSGAWKTRIPGFQQAEAEAAARAHVQTAREEGAAPDGRPRPPETPAEKVALKMARGMAKVWEAGEFDELFTYLFLVIPPDMRGDMVDIIVGIVGPEAFGQAPAPTNGGSGPDLSGYRRMTEAEMWEAAANEAARMPSQEE